MKAVLGGGPVSQTQPPTRTVSSVTILLFPVICFAVRQLQCWSQVNWTLCLLLAGVVRVVVKRYVYAVIYCMQSGSTKVTDYFV